MEYAKPQDPSEEEENKENKSRKRPNFLMTWLAARHEQEKQPEDDSETDDDSEKPKKRRKGIFRKFFTKHVSLEPAKSYSEPLIQEPITEQITDSTMYSSEITKPAREDPEYTESLPPESTDDVAPQSWVEIPHTGGRTDKDSITHQSKEVFAAYPEPIIDEELRYQQHIDAQNDVSQTWVTQTESNRGPNSIRNVSNREPLAAVTLMGLGAEYIGRKRENRAQDKRIESLEKETKVSQKDTKAIQIEQSRKIDRAPAPSLHTEVEKPLEKYPVMDQNMPETRESRTLEQKPVVQRDELAEQVARKVEQYERHQEAPAAVLKEMLTAAEVNAPVERYYERRQEVRDEPSVGDGQSAGAVSVGAILQQTTPSYAASPTLKTTNAQSGRTSPSEQQDEQQLYKQAMQLGFAGALFILIFALMAYLLL